MWRRTMRTLLISVLAATGLPLTAVMADDDCAIQISQRVLDFGTFNSTQLTSKNRLDLASLGKRYLQLSVTCPDPSRMALTFHAQAVGLRAFNMSSLGVFTLDVKDARLDGKQVLLGRVSNTQELPVSVQSTMRLLPNSYLVPVNSGRLGVGKVLNVTLEIEVQAKAETRKVRDKTTMEAEGRFEVINSMRTAAQGVL